MFLFHGSKLITFCVMRIFVDPCVLSRIGLGSQVYKVSEPGKPGFRGLKRYRLPQAQWLGDNGPLLRPRNLKNTLASIKESFKH